MDPNAYGLTVDGDCLAPVVFSGDLVLVSPSAPLKVGEFVVLHPHQGRPLLKRLVCPPPPFEFAPGSDVEGLVIVEQLNPPRHYYIPTRMLHSVHAVVGVMPRERHEAVRVPVPAAAAGAGGPIPGALARRGLLGVAAALAVPVAADASAKSAVAVPTPDAELLALAAEFCELEVSRMTVIEFEAERRNPTYANMLAIRYVLEAFGIGFIDGDEPGVKFAPAPSPAQRSPEPAAVTAAREKLGEHCRRVGRVPAFGPGFLRTANITPDGRPDYILDPAAIECAGEENPYCGGSGGCDHVVIASVGDTYRQVLEVSTRQIRVRSGSDRDVLLITSHDASCAPDVTACEQALAWDGERMAPQP